MPTMNEMPSMKQFLEMVRAGHYLVLDTETTGLSDGEICQIAIVQPDGGVLVDILIKTTRPIPPEATAIHGITDEMVADAASWSEVIPALRKMLTGHNIVVYNAVYDRKMFHQSSEKAGLPKIEWKEISTWWCAMEAYAEFYGDWNDYRGSFRWQSLANACKQQGILNGAAHSALADATATLALIKKMCEAD